MEVDNAAEEEGATAGVEKPPENCNIARMQDPKIVISASELETIIGKHVSREFGERYGMFLFKTLCLPIFCRFCAQGQKEANYVCMVKDKGKGKGKGKGRSREKSSGWVPNNPGEGDLGEGCANLKTLTCAEPVLKTFDEKRRKRENETVRKSREKRRTEADALYERLKKNNKAYYDMCAKNEAKRETLNGVFGQTSKCGFDSTADDSELIDKSTLRSMLKDKNNPRLEDIKKMEEVVHTSEKRVNRQKRLSSKLDKEIKMAVVHLQVREKSYAHHLHTSLIDDQLTQLDLHDEHYDSKQVLMVQIKGLFKNMCEQDQHRLQCQQQTSPHITSTGGDKIAAAQGGSSAREPSQASVLADQNRAFEIPTILMDFTSLESQPYQLPGFQSIIGPTGTETINEAQDQNMPFGGQEAPADSLLIQSGSYARVPEDQGIPLVLHENQPDLMIQRDEGVGIQLHIPDTLSARMEPVNFKDTQTIQGCLICEEGLPGFCLLCGLDNYFED